MFAATEGQYDSLLKLIDDYELRLSEVEANSDEAASIRDSLYFTRLEAGDLADYISRKYDELMLGETE